jgi:hypothetical protein
VTPPHLGCRTRDFRDRLAGGILPAIRRTRPKDWQTRDEAGLHDARLQELSSAPEAFYEPAGMPASAITDVQGALAEHLGSHRETLLAVLFAPDRLLDRLCEAPGNQTAGVASIWLRLCWIIEAAWREVAGDRETHRPAAGALPPHALGLSLVDRALLYPVVARHRFLVLSEPLRHRAEPNSPWTPDPLTLEQYGAYGLLGRAFGPDSWSLLVDRCREARWAWQRCLDEYQSHPLLAQARPKELEAELTSLVFAQGQATGPLVISWAPLADRAPQTSDDQAVTMELVEGHLLPRFKLASVALLAAHGPTQTDRLGRRAVTALVLAAAVGAVALVARGRVEQAASAAAGGYLLLGLGLVAFGRLWAAQWLLRLPAAGAVGLLVLLTLPPTWWAHPLRRWWAPAVLAGAAYGYLVVEARNHGAAGPAAAARALGVAVAGALHALLVCLLGLVLVAPTFVQDGRILERLWTHPGGNRGQAWWVLLLACSWCLAVGVFSQILWEDRPITAPLAHLQWRRGR